MADNNNPKPRVTRGFPNPALDRADLPLDLNRLVVKNPASTFYMRIASDDYENLGVYRGDIAVIDRSLTAKPGRVAAIVGEGEFHLAPMPDKPSGETEVWGVVTHVIHKLKS